MITMSVLEEREGKLLRFWCFFSLVVEVSVSEKKEKGERGERLRITFTHFRSYLPPVSSSLTRTHKQHDEGKKPQGTGDIHISCRGDACPITHIYLTTN